MDSSFALTLQKFFFTKNMLTNANPHQSSECLRPSSARKARIVRFFNLPHANEEEPSVQEILDLRDLPTLIG